MIELGIGHEAFWLGMLRHLWQTVLVIVPIWGLDRALSRAPARFHCTLWWMALLKFLVPLSLVAPVIAPWLPVFSWGRASVTVTTAWAGLRTVLEPAALARDAGGSSAGAGFLALSAVWLAVGMLLAGIGLWRAWRRSRATMDSASASTHDVLRSAAEQAGVSSRRVRITEQPIMPSLVGLLQSRILMPRSLCEKLSVQELRAILVHEDAHRRRRDPAAGLIALAALSLFWFFPPLWLVLRKLRHAAELACDEAVLRAGIAPETYARALARTVRLGFLQPLGATAFARSNEPALAERFHRIRNPRRFRPMIRHRLIVALALLLVVGSMVAAGAAVGGQQSGGAGKWRSEIVDDFTELASLRGADKVASIEMTDRPLLRVLERLAQIGGFEIDTSALDGTRRVSLTVRNTSVAEALVMLSRSEGIFYEVWHEALLPGLGNDRLVVGVPRRIGREGYVPVPRRIVYVAPEYPEAARRAKLAGTVVLAVIVAANGAVEDVRVLEGIHPLLDESAVAAAKQWRYTPVRDGDPPGAMLLSMLAVTVQFQIE